MYYCYIHTYILAHSLLARGYSVVDYIKYLHLQVIYYTNYLCGRVEGLPKAPHAAAIRPIRNLPTILNYLYLQFFLVIFLTINPTHPVNFPCGRKPENLEKTHDFRQSVDELLPRAIRCSIQGSNP